MSKRHLHPIGLATLLLASFLASAWLLPRLQFRPGDYPGLQTVPEIPQQSKDYFWITSAKEEISHIALYHDFGKSIEHAREADILLFGNSRQQTGLREAVIHEEAARLGLKAFTIATGHADKTRFALELIRRHNLRPRVVVASGGPFVFTEGVSPWAREVMAMDRWGALKKIMELSAAWAVQSRLHQYLPRIDYFDHSLIQGGVKYRSNRTGWWHIELEPDGSYPVSMAPERRNYRHTLELTRKLKTELDRRGATLVLTVVPYRGTRTGHLPYLSSELGVPFVLPSFDNMVTSDGSHLNRESAIRYSSLFWGEFIRLPDVRKKLNIN